jgi:FAD dependent oxidoreductase TIGR03364
MGKRTAIVVGAGIVGLATARALAIKGYAVRVFDRTHQAVGASIRNFGMIWPIGQPGGKLYERAINSRNIWREIAERGVITCNNCGSLHLAYHEDEWIVLQELYKAFHAEGRDVSLLNPARTLEASPAVVEKNLLGALWSAEELIIDPREAIGALPGFLTEAYGVEFFWGNCVTRAGTSSVWVGQQLHQADLVFICSGADFETLYPEEFSRFPFTKCKLQMLRLVAQPDGWKIGPAICGGLSLVHYKSFTAAESLPILKKRYELEMGEFLKWGIHVMVSQNLKGELTVGDSHEYAPTHDPFDKAFINKMILDYLTQFASFKDWTLTETWNGIYPKLTNGETDLFFSPEEGVHIVNGVGGAGMTLSFGLAEELIERLHPS